MWVPMIDSTEYPVWTIILMLHGVARLPATAAGLETASRFKREKDFPRVSGAQTGWTRQITNKTPVPALRRHGQPGTARAAS